MTTNPTAALPHRPRIIPGLTLLSRRPDEAQLGHDLMVTGFPDAHERLRSLDGTRTCAEVLDTSDQPDELRRLLGTLSSAGLLEDADEEHGRRPGRVAADMAQRTVAGGHATTAPVTRADAMVVVHGDGRIATAVAAALAGAGIGSVHVAAAGAVQAEDCGAGYADTDIGTPRAQVAARLLRAASSSVRTERPAPGCLPQLVVFTDTPVPDPDAVAAFRLAGIPHLLAYPRGGIGIVGPLVLPGRTGCVRCLDLLRTEREPCWPRLATQLAGRAQPAPLSVGLAVGAFAAAQALRFLDGEPVTDLHDAAVDIDPDRMRTSHRSWARHPACTCSPETDHGHHREVDAPSS